MHHLCQTNPVAKCERCLVGVRLGLPQECAAALYDARRQTAAVPNDSIWGQTLDGVFLGLKRAGVVSD